MKKIESFLAEYNKLENENNILENENNILKSKILLLEDQIKWFNRQVFGSKSEKTKYNEPQNDNCVQLSLFDIPEYEIEIEETEVEKITYECKKKTKKKGYKEEQLTGLPVEKVVAKLDPNDLTCKDCSCEMKVIAKEFVRDELIYIPAKLSVRKYYREVAKCICNNNSKDKSSNFIKANTPKPLIPHSYASPSVVSEIFYKKFVEGTPFQRQANFWNSVGLKISDHSLSNWAINCATDYLKPLVNYLHEQLLTQDILHADETVIQVLREAQKKPQTKSYLWSACSIENNKHPIHIFQYNPKRDQDACNKLLNGFEGYLMCDGYSTYNNLLNVKNVRCWAHARRYFMEALPKENQEKSPAYTALHYINELFNIDREIKEANYDFAKREAIRKEKSSKVLRNFWRFVDRESLKVFYKSKLHKAFNYCIKYRKDLSRFLEDGRLELSNNLAERAIRPTVIGRKNWLFSTSVNGANTNAWIFSIIETAKLNGLKPKKYLEYLLKNLSQEEFLEDKSQKKAILEAYLPWNENVQNSCK